MSQLINLHVNDEMAKVTQNVVDLFESIKTHYVVNYSDSLHGSEFGFKFGDLPICEHYIKVGYKKPTATLNLSHINWEFSSKVLGKTDTQIVNEQALVRKTEGNEKANNYNQTLQQALDAYFGVNIVTVKIISGSFSYPLRFCIDITHITDAVTNAASILLQHSNLHVRATPLKLYRV